MQQADSQRGGVTGGRGLTFPIKLRCGKVADLGAEPGLEDALARALGRAFATAQTALPAALAVGQGVVLNYPCLVNPAQVDARDADQVLRRVRRAIEAAAHARSLPLGLPEPDERPSGAKPIRSASFERFDDARVDVDSGGYDIPSYDGRRVAAPVAHRRSKRRWHVGRKVTLHLSLDSFLDWLGSLDPDKPDAADKTAYLDFLPAVNPAIAWLVVADAVWDAEDLAGDVAEYFAEQVPAGLKYRYGYTIYEESRQTLANLVRDGHPLESLGPLRPGHRQRNAGWVMRGGAMLFVAMPVPDTSLQTLMTLGGQRSVTMKVRDLDFLFGERTFATNFRGILWEDYKSEFGDRPVAVNLLPIHPNTASHYETLKLRVTEFVAGQTPQDMAFFGQLRVLNQDTLNWAPPPLRSDIDRITDDATRTVDAQKRFGVWDPDWVGGYIFVQLKLAPDELAQARQRPAALRVLPDMVNWVKQEPGWDWHKGFYRFLKDTFGDRPPGTRPDDGTVFEYVLAELEKQGLLETLFSDVEGAYEGLGAWHLTLRLALATRYRDHPRVQLSQARINARTLSDRANLYRVTPERGAPSILLDRKESLVVGRGMALGSVDGIYIFERADKRMKAASQTRLKAEIHKQAKDLVAELLHSASAKEYSDDAFAREVLDRAVKEIGLSDNDFEKITVQRSLMLVDVTLKTVDALPRYFITYQPVERVEGEVTWESTAQPLTEIDDDFEARLVYWRLGRAGEFWDTVFKVEIGVALIAVAWEAEIVAALVEIAGGTTSVLVSITISELFYLYRVIFKGEEFSFKGLMVAALDGYLGAVGFSGAGVIGTRLATAIGRKSVERLVGGWVVEKLAVGALGGAGTAALTTFSHDLINMASGDGKWSGIETYLSNMAVGAVFGLAIEFVGAPVIKSLGGRALEAVTDARDLAKLLRKEGLSSARASSELTEGLAGLKAPLRDVIGDVGANRFMQAASRRLSGVLDEMGARFVTSRVLALADVSLTKVGRSGLEKLLAATEQRAGRADLLLKSLGENPSQANAFLEAVNTLDVATMRRVLDGFDGEAAQMSNFLARLGRLSGPERLSILKVLLAAEEGGNAVSRSTQDALQRQIEAPVPTTTATPPAAPTVAGATDPVAYLDAVRRDPIAPGSAGRGWDYQRFPNAPRGARWRPGDPIDMPGRDGYPTFDTARGRYWSKRAHFELEARKTGASRRLPGSQDSIQRLSDADLEAIKQSRHAPPAPNLPGRTMELEHSGVPQRARDWMEALGFKAEEARRLTEVSNPAALLEVEPLEHAFFDAEAWGFGSQRADVGGQRWSGTQAADARVQRPIIDMSDAQILEIERLAQARNLDFNANPGARSLRAALDAEIQARTLTVPGGPTPPAGGATPPPTGGGTPPPAGGSPHPPAGGSPPPATPPPGGGTPPPLTGSGPPSPPPGAPATPPPPPIIPVSPNMNISGDTAGTGGVTAISGSRAQDGSQQISIDGRVLPSLGASRQGFETNLVRGSDLGLSNYDLLHLWGPRLGDEAAAGIWLAPKTINIGVQARVEAQVEGLAQVANSQGGRLTLRVTGSTHPRAELPPNLRAHDFLAEVKYQFTVEVPGTPAASGEVTIRIGAPPDGRLELLGAASLDRLTKVPR